MESPQNILNPLESIDQCRSVVDLLPEGVMMLTAEGAILHLNPAALTVLEAETLDQLRDKPFLPIVAPEFRSAFLALFHKVGAGSRDSFEFQITGLRGSRRWVETHATPFPYELAGGQALLAVCRDTTERVQREGRDRYFQKMDAISTLTSSVAHDFNNILTSIVGYANVLKLKLPAADPMHGLAQQILASADRAAVLIKSMLAFGSKQILDLATTPLSRALQLTIDSIAPDLAPVVKVQLSDGAPPDTSVLVDQSQLAQALRHILLNARDAMRSGGTITVSTSIMELEDTFISIHGYGTKGAYAVIAFTDTGEGMSEETRRKAFEPFFTTREFGQGLGLGLAIVYGTIKSHKGFVNIYSEAGVGTTVRVYLPVADLPRSNAMDDQLVPSGNGETILLAEDDRHIRSIMTSVLEQFGYRVIATATAESALEEFKAGPERIDLALLDAVLPGMSGSELGDAILRIRPETRIIMTSGHTPDLLRAKGLLRPGIGFISKPVSPRDLLQKIREVLSQ
jgi:PAS domain S-box-containing protein